MSKQNSSLKQQIQEVLDADYFVSTDVKLKILALVDSATQQLQNETITGEIIRFGIDSLDAIADWKGKHKLQDTEFIPIEKILAVLNACSSQENAKEVS